MSKYSGRKAIALLAVVFGLIIAATLAPTAANAGGTGGSSCGSGAPSGASQMNYNEYSGNVYDTVYTADANNCATTVDVLDVTKSVSGSVVTYRAAAGVTFSFVSVSVTDPYDANQSGSYNVPLKSGATSASYDINNLPVFIYHPAKKNGKAGKTQYVRRVNGVYISGSDTNYPAAPGYNGCNPNGCG